MAPKKSEKRKAASKPVRKMSEKQRTARTAAKRKRSIAASSEKKGTSKALDTLVSQYARAMTGKSKLTRADKAKARKEVMKKLRLLTIGKSKDGVPRLTARGKPVGKTGRRPLLKAGKVGGKGVSKYAYAVRRARKGRPQAAKRVACDTPSRYPKVVRDKKGEAPHVRCAPHKRESRKAKAKADKPSKAEKRKYGTVKQLTRVQRRPGAKGRPLSKYLQAVNAARKGGMIKTPVGQKLTDADRRKIRAIYNKMVGAGAGRAAAAAAAAAKESKPRRSKRLASRR